MGDLVCYWMAQRGQQSVQLWCSTGTSLMGWECTKKSSFLVSSLTYYLQSAQITDHIWFTLLCVIVCDAGGSSLLVGKLECIWDHPAHHGRAQAAACHHAFPCKGWACAGPCPAGLANTSAYVTDVTASCRHTTKETCSWHLMQQLKWLLEINHKDNSKYWKAVKYLVSTS